MITLWDTAGQEDYDRLRPLSYPMTDVFVMCYAVDNAATLTMLEKRFVPEKQHHVPDARIVVVGALLLLCFLCCLSLSLS